MESLVRHICVCRSSPSKTIVKRYASACLSIFRKSCYITVFFDIIVVFETRYHPGSLRDHSYFTRSEEYVCTCFGHCRCRRHYIFNAFVNEFHCLDSIRIIKTGFVIICQYTSAHGVDNIHPCILLVRRVCCETILASVFFCKFLCDIIEFIPCPASVRIVDSCFIKHIFVIPHSDCVDILRYCVCFSVPLIHFFDIFREFVHFQFVAVCNLVCQIK